MYNYVRMVLLFAVISLLPTKVFATFSASASGTYAREVAGALDYMSAHITNAGQQSLVQVFSQVPASQLNHAYKEMIANINTDTSTFVVVNSVVDRVETRVAAIPDWGDMDGYGSGNLCPNMSLWIAGLGNIAKQKQNAEGVNTGYRIRAAGVLGGIDGELGQGQIFGLALGSTNSNVYEMSNNNFTTRILSAYILQYGSLYSKSSFFEWVIVGATNKNVASRQVYLSTHNYTVSANYRTWLAGLKFNLGNYFDVLDALRYSYLVSLQYSLLCNPAYSEYGTIPALKVTPQHLQNLLTAGAGLRLSWPGDDPYVTGLREIHALVTYDLIQPNQTTTMSFVVGSPSFAMTNIKPARLGYRVGADFAVTCCEVFQFQLSYDFEGSSRFYDHVAELKFRVLF